MRLAEQNHLPLYGIAYKDKPEDSSRLLATFGDPYRQVGVDRDGRVGLDFGVYGVPETYVIDSTGAIRRRFVGPLTAETVDKELLPLLKQLGSVMKAWSHLRRLILLAALAAHAVEPSERLADPALEARARTISSQLRCLVCQNESIDEFRRRPRARHPHVRPRSG